MHGFPWQLHITDFSQTLLKLFLKIGTFYQLTNPWKKLFKTSQL